MHDLYNANVPTNAVILYATPFQSNTAILTIYRLPDGSYWRTTNWTQDSPQSITEDEALNWTRGGC